MCCTTITRMQSKRHNIWKRALLIGGILVSCIPVIGCGGEAGLLGLLAGFDAFVPSEEELAAFEKELDVFKEKVAALPETAVHIINQTGETVRVEIVAGMVGPRADEFLGLDIFGPGSVPGESLLNEIDRHEVLIGPHGNVQGRIKCGEVIGLSVQAPFDGYGRYGGNETFGLYLDNGNVQISGAGVSHETFTGDVIGARYVRPLEEGLVCESGTLLLIIESTVTSDRSEGIPRGSAILSIE